MMIGDGEVDVSLCWSLESTASHPRLEVTAYGWRWPASRGMPIEKGTDVFVRDVEENSLLDHP